MRWLALFVVVVACKPGGEYVRSDRQGGEVDRGETNGRTFEMISNRPDGDDWQIRIRDSSMWAAYSDGEDTEDLGNVNLDQKETERVWGLIDTVDIGSRKKGKRDEDEGYVQLRLNEPGDEGREILSIFVSRATEDEEVLDLGRYIIKLIKKYHKQEAEL